jgi:hypothetical protein
LQKTHDFRRTHPSAKQFLHGSFGLGARKDAARFQLLDQQNCGACGHFGGVLAPLTSSE